MKTVDQSPHIHAHTIETATKGQRFQLQDNRPGAVAQAKLVEAIQRRALAPQHTGAATVAGPVNQPNRDTVAPGPAHVASYTLNVTNPALNRNAALGNIRTEYRFVGTGYQDKKFLASASLIKKCGADSNVAAHVYDRFQAGGVDMGVALTDKKPKADYLKANKDLLNVPANLDHLRNDAGFPDFFDPVEVYVSAGYGAASPLEARIDFTEGQKGYITKIKDAGGVDASIADRPNYAGEFPKPDARIPQLITEGLAVVDDIDSYSNVHHVGIDEDAGTQIARVGTGAPDTRLHLEAGLDAMTKVIAEGGRFKCVEALGTALKNSSLFYAPKDAGFRTVNFQNLWGMWQSPFKGKYGVEDDTIKDHIRKDPLPKNVVEVAAEPAGGGYNYNLNTHQVR